MDELAALPGVAPHADLVRDLSAAVGGYHFERAAVVLASLERALGLDA